MGDIYHPMATGLGTKDHTLRFGNIRGEFITFQQSLKLFRSELTASFISAIDFDENEMLVSSAYIVTLCFVAHRANHLCTSKIAVGRGTILTVCRSSRLLLLMYVHLRSSIAYHPVCTI